MKLLNLRGRASVATPVGNGHSDSRPDSRRRKDKKRKKQPTRREMLALRPLRNPALEWSIEDGQVVLQVKRDKSNWKLKLLNIFVPTDALSDSRHVVLDPIGSDVWQMLDGKTTIEHITKALARKYKLTPREAELSLQQFFKELGRRGYVAFSMEQIKQ